MSSRQEKDLTKKAHQSHVAKAVEQASGLDPKDALRQVGSSSLSDVEKLNALGQICIEGLKKEQGIKPKKKRRKKKHGRRNKK